MGKNVKGDKESTPEKGSTSKSFKKTKKAARPMSVRKIHGACANELIKKIEKVKIETPIGAPKMHATCAFIGSCNSGKTNAMINLAKTLEEYGSVNRIIVMSPTFEANEAFDEITVDKKDVYGGEHVLNNTIACVQDVEHKVKMAAKEWDAHLAYIEAWKAFADGSATMSQTNLLSNNLFKEPEEMDRPRFLLILDDLSHTGIYSKKSANKFNNMLLRHRHVYGLGLTIFMAVQNFTTGIPKVLRQNISQFYLWGTHDNTQLEAIYEQVAGGVSKEDFYAAFHYATAEPHHFLTVDLNSSGLSYLRKDFNEEIIFEDSD